MPKGYHHLTYDQRCQIFTLLKSNFSRRAIAKSLKVSTRTIDREIERNKGLRGYRYKQAQNKATKRRVLASSIPRKMTAKVKLVINQWLIESQWSPEQIAGRLKIECAISISPESIYKYIWLDKKRGGTLYQYLRHSGKKYNKRSGKTAGRGLIPNRIDISKRPKIVDQKKRVGDFEIDTIIGAQHRGAIVSIVDRKSKVTFLALVDRKTSDNVAEALIKKLEPIKDYVHTITSDNGKEFADHQKVAQTLGAGFYFAQPYHSWERGLNENTNGLIRQYFPKKTNFNTLTYEHVQIVQNKLNNRPRKTLGFKTPLEIFLKITGTNLTATLQS